MAVSPLKHRVKRVTSAETADCIRNLQILFLKIVLIFITHLELVFFNLQQALA